MNKILVDTNILISAIVFDRNELDVILRGIKKGDSIHISEHITEEATRVILKKFPDNVKTISIQNLGPLLLTDNSLASLR